MKLYSIKKRMALFLVNRILSGTRYFSMKRRLLNAVGYEVGIGTRIVGPVHNTGKLKTGRNCWVGKNLTIHGNGTVQIGDNCDIAPDVLFLTGGHRLGDASRRAGPEETYTIKVGNGVWIGARATIGKSVEIGSGCMVAACACVMQDVAANTMVGGVPAKIIKELDYADSPDIAK